MYTTNTNILLIVVVCVDGYPCNRGSQSTRMATRRISDTLDHDLDLGSASKISSPNKYGLGHMGQHRCQESNSFVIG